MKFQYGWAFPDADEQMMREIAPDGSYQATHLAAALGLVRDWSLAVDAGAHVGTWSKVLSGRFARVLAIEPSPDTAEALAANMATFGCANVEIRQVALGDRPGFVEMRLDPKAAALKNTGGRHVGDGGTIPRITLDSLELPQVGFLKLDIEGSELVALRGATRTLARCRPLVLYESKWLWTRHFGLPKDAVRDLLTAAGYRLLLKVGNDQIWGPW